MVKKKFKEGRCLKCKGLLFKYNLKISILIKDNLLFNETGIEIMCPKNDCKNLNILALENN